MENKELKQPESKDKSIQDIQFETQGLFNQIYINDLTRLIKTNTTVPTYIPKKFIDCFYLYWNGTTTYELYIYINNTWKKTTLS